MFSDRGDEDKAMIIVAAIIEKEGKLLMVQEGDPKVAGLWNVPSGHIESGEDPISALKREVKEETGYDIEATALGKLYSWKYEVGVPALRFSFYGKIVSGDESEKGEEIMSLEWMSREQLEKLHEENKFRSEKTWWVIKDWVEGNKYPIETIKVLTETFN